MKAKLSLNKTWCILILALTLFTSGTGQTSCTVQGQGQQTAWEQNAQVNVNISPNFSSAEQQAIVQAFTNWQNASGPSGNGSGVSFTFTYSATPISGSDTYQVNKASPTSCTCQAETGGTFDVSTNTRNSAFTNMDSAVTDPSAMTQAMAHEIGHTFGLADCSACADGTSVMTLADSMNDTTSGRSAPSDCDNTVAKTTGGYGTADGDPPLGCEQDVEFVNGDLCDTLQSPILVDVLGDGYRLVSATDGVSFDLNASGALQRTAWTAPGSDDAFLAIDRNGNGTIDDGSELFGDHTEQAASPAPNGFRALMLFDQMEEGGNEDGKINESDAIFSALKLWTDWNHDGISQPGEIIPASDVISAIELQYAWIGRRDQFGNIFRYRAKIVRKSGPAISPWIYDVYFTIR